MYAYHRFEFNNGLDILSNYTVLQESLGITFNSVEILQQALVHRSYLNENPNPALASNERLEFLGDAVLGFVVAEDLYQRLPHSSEGELTNLRSALVRGETLGRIALSLGLQDYLFLGKGEDDSGGRSRIRNLSCALEAVIGAVLVDKGFDPARDFVLRIMQGEYERLLGNEFKIDYKSRLQQMIQSERKITPSYRTINEEGPAHAKVFTVEVVAGEETLGQGSGTNKRAAEMEAARFAIENLEEE